MLLFIWTESFQMINLRSLKYVIGVQERCESLKNIIRKHVNCFLSLLSNPFLVIGVQRHLLRSLLIEHRKKVKSWTKLRSIIVLVYSLNPCYKFMVIAHKVCNNAVRLILILASSINLLKKFVCSFTIDANAHLLFHFVFSRKNWFKK